MILAMIGAYHKYFIGNQRLKIIFAAESKKFLFSYVATYNLHVSHEIFNIQHISRSEYRNYDGPNISKNALMA